MVPDPIGGVPTAAEQQAYDDAVAKFAAIPDPTPDDIAEYEAAVAAYKAACTPDNQAEIEAAEKQNADAAEIKALIDELTAAERVALDDQRVTDALDLLVQRNLLAPDRPAEIVQYDRPFPEVNTDVPEVNGDE